MLRASGTKACGSGRALQTVAPRPSSPAGKAGGHRRGGNAIVQCANAAAASVTSVTAPPSSSLDAGNGPSTSGAASADEQPALPTRMVKQLKLKSAACYLPHPEKEHYGGEDAHFVSEVGGGALGVADGVGGWQESGINPAVYSRTLMRVACAHMEGADPQASLDGSAASSANASLMGSLSSYDAGSMSSFDGALASACPRQALDMAHRLTRVPGSATACVVALCQERRILTAANLGDSGFLVLRRGAVALRSQPLQHFFDCPLQFGAYPEHVDATDTADQAEMFDLEVEVGDVIIAGSDGLWDNTYEEEVLGLAPSGAGQVDDAARRIAALARAHASDPDFESPYVREAKRQGLDLSWWDKVKGISFKGGKLQLGELSGGKLDDITVLVAVVTEEELELPGSFLVAASSSDEQAAGEATGAPAPQA